MILLLNMQTAGEIFSKICLKAIQGTFSSMSSATMKEQGDMKKNSGRSIFGGERKKWGDIQEKGRFLEYCATRGYPLVSLSLVGTLD